MNKTLFDTEPETVKPPQLKNHSILQALVKSSWCLSLAVGVLCVRPARILPTLGISWIISVCCSLSNLSRHWGGKNAKGKNPGCCVHTYPKLRWQSGDNCTYHRLKMIRSE